MATFIALTLWHGKFTDEFGSQAPDPPAFGLPVHDDGARGEPLLSGASAPATAYQPDIAALTAVSTRVVIAAGIERQRLLTWRASAALGLELTVFPRNHGGFLGPESGRPGQPEPFAARLG